MSATVHELIGQIINPGPAARETAQPRAAAAPAEPLHALIGRTIGPPARMSAAPQAAQPELVVPPPAM
jgi:hypothetical protein